MSTLRPPDDVILLSMLLRGGNDRPSAALGRLAREEFPTIEVAPMRWSPRWKVYSLTPWALNQLDNRWPALGPLIRERRASRRIDDEIKKRERA